MKSLGPERSLRSTADGIDAWFRILLSFRIVNIWIILVALLFTGERHHLWAYAAIACGLPFPASLVFAVLTLKSWLDERGWMRAEETARRSPSARSGGTT